MSFLESQAWQGISGMLAIAAIVITIVIYRRQTAHKALGFRVVSDAPILREPEVLSGKMSIQVLGAQVTYLRLIVVHIRNVGKSPIQRADYDGPIELKLSATPKFTLASHTSANPAGLPITLITAPDRVHIEPLLLNPGDSFNVQLALDNADATLEVNARISGVKELTMLRESDEVPEQPATTRILELIRYTAIVATIAVAASATLASKYQDFREALPVIISNVIKLLR